MTGIYDYYDEELVEDFNNYSVEIPWFKLVTPSDYWPLFKGETMTVQFRNFSEDPGYNDDFFKVHEFLVTSYKEKSLEFDFEWSRWEWCYSHSFFDHTTQGNIGIWEENKEIVAMATYEDKLGSAYLITRNGFACLREEMLAYAIDNLCKDDGSIRLLINNSDQELQNLAYKNGFRATRENEGRSVIYIDETDLSFSLPSGFRIINLVNGIDIKKHNRMMWKGFNHQGPAPETRERLKSRQKMVSQPHLNPELNSIVMSPVGEYCSYCGVWYDQRTDYVLIEPVATVPEHRRKGLGKAAVLSSIANAAKLGAKLAYVGSSQQFYYQIGFRPLPQCIYWKKI